MPEVVGGFDLNLPELFSRLFFVAASRLNSPRFPLCLYASAKKAVKQSDQVRVKALLRLSLIDGEGPWQDTKTVAFRLSRPMCGRSVTLGMARLAIGLCPPS